MAEFVRELPIEASPATIFRPLASTSKLCRMSG